MNYPKTKRTLMSMAVAGAFTSIVVPGHAQQAGNSPAADTQTVTVTGIRRSLISTMNMKRNSDGIVDGIVAEDIGKFPDTNLAESLQRISGVSIDRTNNEGSKVTVRGVGPDYNLVLLNGRQMPTSGFEGLNAPRGRSFDFSNLASEAISQIQVYKSARADTPTGGIGATLNVMTARPLDNPGFHASVGVKGVYDTGFKDLPKDVKAGGSQITPEVSGIYSQTFADNRFGISVSASRQERNGGFSGADTAGYFSYKGHGGDWGQLPATSNGDQPNYPGANTVYEKPVSIGYSMHSIKRTRENAQLAFQFAPTKDIKTTLDYTYALNKVQDRAASLGAWFSGNPEPATTINGSAAPGTVWTLGDVSSPSFYTENYGGGRSDTSVAGALTATKTKLGSLGFNATWKVDDKLKLEFDTHHSKSDTTPDSIYGYNNSLGVASFGRFGNTVDYSSDLPILHIYDIDYNTYTPRVTGSSFRNGFQRAEVDQTQAKGSLKLFESSTLNFGLSATKYQNHSAYVDNQHPSWSEAGAAPNDYNYAANTFHLDDMRNYFKHVGGSGNSNWSTQIVTFNFEDLANQISEKTGHPEWYRVSDISTDPTRTDLGTTEKSQSAYVQFNTDWDTELPIHTGVGLRFEKTKITSTALVVPPAGYTMNSANEYSVTLSPAAPTFTNLTGSYHYVLPTLDADMDVASDQKVRVSYSESLGRPGWDDIQGGQIVSTFARQGGGTGRQGNPDLKPVKSRNIDLSYEWYYAKQSYLSAGFFRKNLRNFTGTDIVTLPQLFGIRTPVNGAYWNEAIAAGCAANNSSCIYNWIIANKQGSPGVTATTIAGQPGDPLATFDITQPVNKESAGINGVELNVQHMFGNSGFGFAANYTYVRSNLQFDNRSVTSQFVLPGISNSGNLVGIYEDNKWSIRAAYNWRGEFYSNSGASQTAVQNPVYVEPYGQVDVNVGYTINPNLSLSFEAINLTNSVQRAHTRTKEAFAYVNQFSARYMLGARYKF